MKPNLEGLIQGPGTGQLITPACTAAEAIAGRQTYFTVHHLDPAGDTDTETLYTNNDGLTAYEFYDDESDIEIYASLKATIHDYPGGALITYDDSVYLYAALDMLGESGVEFDYRTNELIDYTTVPESVFCASVTGIPFTGINLENLTMGEIREAHETILYNVFGDASKEKIYRMLRQIVKDPQNETEAEMKAALNLK